MFYFLCVHEFSPIVSVFKTSVYDGSGPSLLPTVSLIHTTSRLNSMASNRLETSSIFSSLVKRNPKFKTFLLHIKFLLWDFKFSRFVLKNTNDDNNNNSVHLFGHFTDFNQI